MSPAPNLVCVECGDLIPADGEMCWLGDSGPYHEACLPSARALLAELAEHRAFVPEFLGWYDTATISPYERRVRLPPLVTKARRLAAERSGR